VVGAALLVYYRKRLDRWILFGAFFFLLNLGPVLGLIPFGYMSHSFVADHFMYLPMVGLAIVCARILDSTYNAINYQTTAGKLLAAGVIVWICALGALSAMQTSVWRNPLTMWEATLKANPRGYAALNNYGLALSRRGEYEKAISVLKKAIDVAPKTAMGYDNLASVYVRTRRFAEAAELYKKSIQVNPRGELSHAMLARLKRQEGKIDEAITLLERSVKQLPRSARLFFELGLMNAAAGHHDEALAAYQKSADIQPFFPDPYVKMGIIFLDRGQADLAITRLKKAVELSPRADACNALGAAFAQKGEFQKAAEYFRKAFSINPKLPGIQDNLAHALIDAGNYQAAREHCRRGQARGSPCSSEVLKRIKLR
jgi:tetratricopeptide (TPR) repeat protein